MEKKFYRFKTECWAPPTFKSYLWYPDIYVWVLGGGVLGGLENMGKKFYRFKTECWVPLTFKSYLWYPDIYVWVLGVGWWWEGP